MRARMALALTNQQFEIREVLLKDKPPSLFEYSAAGTVPVLILPNGSVLDESIDIMRWASDKLSAVVSGVFNSSEALSLIEYNDGEFKHYLDRYKYFDRFVEYPQDYYLSKCQAFLESLEQHLSEQQFLLGEKAGFIDLAIFPFIRQFAFVDKVAFDCLPYSKLQTWLSFFLDSALFKQIMTKYAFWKPEDEPVFFQCTQTDIN
jgi:glutathione S-transferase